LALAKDLYGKDVFTSDGKKLGEAVNLLVNMQTAEADILVFPHLVSKLIRSHSGQIVETIAGQAFSQLKRIVIDDIAGIAVDEIGGAVSKRLDTKVKTKVRVVEESCYLIPAAFLRDFSLNAVNLNVAYEECRKWFLNAMPPPEAYMSFFPPSQYQGPKRPVSITLNTQPIEGVTVRDSMGGEGQVRDVQFEFPSGMSVGIIVADPAGASRLVNVKELTPEGNKLIMNKKLGECPLVGAR
jgi:sporulation protein YlmC with PRC-barrel domain